MTFKIRWQSLKQSIYHFNTKIHRTSNSSPTKLFLPPPKRNQQTHLQKLTIKPSTALLPTKTARYTASFHPHPFPFPLPFSLSITTRHASKGPRARSPFTASMRRSRAEHGIVHRRSSLSLSLSLFLSIYDRCRRITIRT